MANFLHPEWWPIFLGLIAPLLIHLWNRREGRTILVGSIQWIPEREQRKINSIRFSDFWRFLIRTLMLVCLCLLILQYLWPNDKQSAYNTKWVLLDPQISTSNGLQRILDSLELAGNDIRYLQKGFPKEKNSANPEVLHSPWTFLKTLAAQNNRPDSILIFSNQYQKDFRTNRPSLPFYVSWQSIPEQNEEPVLLNAWETTESQAILLFALPSASKFSFNKAKVDLLEGDNIILDDPLPTVVLSQNASSEWEVSTKNQKTKLEKQPVLKLDFSKVSKENQYYLKSAVSAIQEYTGVNFIEDSPQADLTFKESISSSSRQYFDQRVDSIFILQNLKYQEATDVVMVQELLPILLESFLPKNIEQYDIRRLDNQLGLPIYKSQTRPTIKDQKQTSLRFDHIVWFLLLSLFLLDRFWMEKT